MYNQSTVYIYVGSSNPMQFSSIFRSNLKKRYHINFQVAPLPFLQEVILPKLEARKNAKIWGLWQVVLPLVDSGGFQVMEGFLPVVLRP